jgi:hypothetical protein
MHQQSGCSSTFSDDHLNIVNHKSSWDISDFHTITSNWLCRIRSDNLISYLHLCMSEYISTFTILVTYKSDKCSSVWIVFDSFNTLLNILLIVLEVNETIETLCSTTLVTNRDTTSIVTTSMSLE